MSDEQRVRTMCGWIGVEISRSRVRTPGKAGYGLYRVRGSVGHRTQAELDGLIPGAVTEDGKAERGPWTAYAFTLEEIERAVVAAIGCGTPAGPQGLGLRDSLTGETVRVPTRWTSAYRGSRTLGTGAETAPVGEGLTVKQRQRKANAEFQAAHLERREHGLRARHAAKLGRVAAEEPAWHRGCTGCWRTVWH